MDSYQGTSVLEKIAIGRIYYHKKSSDTPYREEVGDVTAEIARFDAARDAALAELDGLIREASARTGKEEAAVFAGHRMLVKDHLYRDFVCDVIRAQHVNAEYAVAQAQAHFVQMFLSMDDAYVRERAADVTDVSERLLRLLGRGGGSQSPKEDLPPFDEAPEPLVFAAEELIPSEIIRFDGGQILAFVARQGAVNSHAAILARAMNIPVVFGVDVREDWAGRMAVVDGRGGRVILDPDEACLAQMRKEQREIDEQEAIRTALRAQETVTRSGRRVSLCANISEAADVDAALANGAEGIGLFRSEFLYLQAQDWPTEEEQFAAYRAVVSQMQGKKVVIRTLDAGLDKQLPYLDLSGQERRGIGICLERPEMFRTQLRAILRAGVYGTVAVMFPMITSVDEVRRCRQQLEIARTELRQAEAGERQGQAESGEAGASFGEIEVGIMIETPEAVERSAELAREVDFFCIGTNDLVPALLGFSRLGDAPESLRQSPCHPAVQDAVRTTIGRGHKAGIRVGICGEMAADTAVTGTLVEMGIDELSVAPASILKVREAVRKLY